MTDVLVTARELVDQAWARGHTALTQRELDDIHHRYAGVLAYARAGPDHPLIRRLDARRADYLRFTVDFAVPFTSNGAERDLRMIKLQVKVSGGWRTLQSARHFCRIRSFISTVKKQGHATLDTLTELFAGKVWIPATT